MLAINVRNEKDLKEIEDKIEVQEKRVPGIYVPVHNLYMWHPESDLEFLRRIGYVIVEVQSFL